MMPESELRKRLAEANARLEKAIAALAPRHQGGEWEEYDAAQAAALGLERELSALLGEEYAVPADFPVRWDMGAPLPHVLQNDHMCLLIFYVAEPPAKNWDGTSVKIVSTGADEPAWLALVEFKGVMAAKLGSPNDEVFSGHPLSGHGQDSYAAQQIINSRWIGELQKINSVHSRYNPDHWRYLRHYIFWFHDSTFECVADEFEVELSTERFPDLLARACQRLLV